MYTYICVPYGLLTLTLTLTPSLLSTDVERESGPEEVSVPIEHLLAMTICPYPPPRYPIFTLDEHGGIVPTEPRNEDEDFRSAVQQLLASDDINNDNAVTDKVEVS